jgi:hypothetical protein
MKAVRGAVGDSQQQIHERADASRIPAEGAIARDYRPQPR